MRFDRRGRAVLAMVVMIAGMFAMPAIASAATCATITMAPTPLNVYQQSVAVGDYNGLGTAYPCDPNGDAIGADSSGSESQANTIAQSTLTATAGTTANGFTGGVFGTFYTDGGYIHYEPTSNPGYAYVTNVTVYYMGTDGLFHPATIVVQVPAAGPTATQSIASKALTQSQTVTAFTPVTGSGGTAPLAYSVNPALPTGLNVNASTGAITGMPTVTSSATTYTVTVTDANSATATNTFSLTVNSAVTATQSVASATLTQNHAATSFTPVTGGGGTGTLSYSVNPALPTGLSLSSTTGAITGTPSVSSSVTTYTVTVTDTNSATATNTFSLTVNSAVTATQNVAATSLTVNHAATSFTPVTGGGGTTPLTFTVAPSLPTGLSLSSSTGQISGTPSVTSSTTTYTVTVTDTNSATATNTFSLTVNSAVTATQSVASKALTQNSATTSFTPVTGSGGTTPLSYSVAPSLPTGLSLSSSTGAVTGTPTASSSATTYTVTVTDANSVTATNTFSLTVNSAVTATQSVASTVLTQSHATTSFTPVTGGGGTGSLSYSVNPALPTGLSLSSTTGTITGTPSVSSSATTYTVTVTDTNSATATNTFSLTVNSAVTATQAVSSASLTQNHAATAFTPITGGGGTGTLSYSIAPSLPAGLSLSSSSGAITGTPTSAAATATYTVTVTDANSATASNTFSLTVSGPIAATTSVASTTLVQNQAATSFTPVTGGGGTGTLSYSVNPALPTGLSLATSTGAITGTPTATSSATTYTVTVTDTNSSTATATFSLTVNPPAPTVTAISPTTGPTTGGTPVTITGTNFTGATSVTIGGAAATSVTVVSATSITAVTPAGAAGTASVLVTTAGGTNAANTLFTYIGPPTVTSISPSAGPIAGGTPVTISGTGFTGATSVTIGGTSATGITVVSSTSITATTPAGVAGAASVVVTTTGGANAANTLFTYVGSPTVTAITPSSGTTAGGTLVTITGTSFTGATSVTIGGVAATGVTVVSSTSITATTPAGAAGSASVIVTTPYGANAANTLFSYSNIPASIAINAGNSQSTTISTAFASPLSVIVKDASNNPIPNATVTFVAPSSGASGSFAGSGVVTTNASGIATAPTFTANGTAGAYAVTATLGALVPVSFALTNTVGAPAQLVQDGGSGQTAPVSTPFGTQLLVTVTDSGGNPLAGVPVTFTAPASGASGTFSATQQRADLPFRSRMLAASFSPIALASGGAGNSITVNTNAQGIAAVYFIANSTTGSYTITASANGQTTSFTLANAKAANVITFAALPAIYFGMPPFTLSATATSGDTVTFASTTPSVCTVSGARVTIVAVGTCAIVASDPGNATYAAATSVPQSFQVNARPDPSKDAEVIGIVNAQTQAAEQFAQIQLGNFNQRLEQMHGDGTVTDRFGISLNDGLNQSDTTRTGFADEADPMARKMGAADTATSRALRKTDKQASEADREKTAALDRAFSFWTAGAISVGRIHANNTVSTTDLTTGGLSAGVDYRFNRLISIGLGLGYGTMSADIGTNGTTTSGRNYDAVIYASIRPTATSFIDAVAGAGLLDFSSNRYITGVGSFANGKRSGHEFFGSVTAGVEIKTKDYMVSPYVRVDGKTGTLNAFDENAPTPWALHYDKETFSTASVDLGIKAQISRRYDDMLVSPFVRAEFQHDLVNNTSAGVTYVDQVGISDNTIAIPGSNQNRIMLGVGSEVATVNDFKLMLEYLNTFSTSSTSDASTVRFKVTKAF